MKDNINPQHYRSQPVECIEITKHMDFLLGNAFKYVWRHKEKNGSEDLNKALWYVNRAKERREVISTTCRADLKTLTAACSELCSIRRCEES